MHEAFTADTYGDRLKGAFTLLEKLGGTLSSSKTPGVSLIGDLVKAYGEIAKEALERAKELEKLIRMREGMCIGLAAHSLLDERSIALEKIAPGTQACPVDVKDEFFKDIYVQTEPPNADQIYFWAGKRMIKGREGGGGVVGVEEAKKFIIEFVKIGFEAYARKENNVRAVAAVYNTIYREEDALKDIPGLSFMSGLPGLRAESDALFEAIVKHD